MISSKLDRLQADSRQKGATHISASSLSRSSNLMPPVLGSISLLITLSKGNGQILIVHDSSAGPPLQATPHSSHLNT